MKLVKKKLVTSTASALLTLSAGVTVAQQQAVDEVSGDRGNSQRLEEVLVTATYRNTNLMDTAGAISALTADFMRNQGAEDMADLFQFVPGLNMTTEAGGNNRFVVRGISSQTGESQLSITASAIGVYLGNVPVSSAVGPAVQMSSTIFDVERVEVLKGPQGTLFGEGSQGGTIRYLFNKADPTKFDAAVTVGGQMIEESDDLGRRIDGMVNLPITDNFAIRAMAFDTTRPGWIDNTAPAEEDFNDAESRGGRLSFNWEASDTIALEGSYYNTKQTVNGVSRSDFGTPYVNTSGRTPNRPPQSTDDFDLFNLVANVDLGFATLTASSAYSEREMLFFHEYNQTLTSLIDFVWFLNEQDAGWPANNPFVDPNLNSITNRNRLISEQQIHELRLVSNDDGALRWTTGVFYKDSDDLYDFDLEVSALPGREQVEPIAVDILTPEDPDALNGLDNMRQWAVYGEVSYDFNPQWTLTVGGRYADLQQELGNQPELGAEDTPFTPKVELSWQPNDDVLVYATYAEGFRQGNTNRLFGATAEQDLIDDIADKEVQEGISEEVRAADLADLRGRLDVTRSERAFEGDTLKNYELGLKTTLFDGRAELRTAAYYIRWTDLIQEFQDPRLIRQFPNDSYNKNLGDAEVMGAELEFSMSLGAGFFWRFGGDLNESEILEGALEGNSLVFAPEYSFNTGLDYTFALTSGMDMTLHGDVAWVGEQFANGANDENRLIPAYHMANARLMLNSTTETEWRASLWVRNLTNEANLTNISHLRQDFFYSPPRAIGFEFGWNY